MAVALDMLEQLGMNMYAEGLNNLKREDAMAWIRYDRPARKLWHKGIMEETCYNVHDVNYHFCGIVHGHFTELYHVAGWSTLMA